VGTISEGIEEGKSPLGRACPRCGGALRFSEGIYKRYYLACTGSGCWYRKSLMVMVADATDLAHLIGIRYGKCGQQVRGRRSGGGVFLGCANYPECCWTKSLESLL
jgi:ssDNA-binding Zn-finger/Zn-ribbon topoisomerase 1